MAFMERRLLLENADDNVMEANQHEGISDAAVGTMSLLCTTILVILMVKGFGDKLPINSNATIFILGFGLAAVTSYMVGLRVDEGEVECARPEGHGGGFWGVGWCALDNVKHISASVFILVLLPPLVYEASSAVDWYVFQRTLNSILYLSVIGVMMAAMIHSVLFELLGISAGWSFAQSLTLGSILAATDPVSVVAALHELNAPPELTTIIDGESLLNDGTAMVLYIIVEAMAFDGAESTVGDVLLEFARLALGGVALGLVSFFLLHEWLSWVTHSWLESTLAVLLVAFGVYFTAEVLVGVSGILAVVTVGLGMGWYGKYAVWPSVVEKLEVVTSTLAAVAEAAIFFFSGIVSMDAISAIQPLQRPHYLWNLVLLYVACHVTRGAVVALGKPVYDLKGYYAMRPKELVVVAFSGLRGALAISLAMNLKQNQFAKKLEARRSGDPAGGGGGVSGGDGVAVEDEIYFYVAGIVILTLLVNGTLIIPFYEWLGVYPEHDAKRSDREASLLDICAGLEDDARAEWNLRRRHDWLLHDAGSGCGGRLGGSEGDGGGGGALAAVEYLVPSLGAITFSRASRVEVFGERDVAQHALAVLLPVALAKPRVSGALASIAAFSRGEHHDDVSGGQGSGSGGAEENGSLGNGSKSFFRYETMSPKSARGGGDFRSNPATPKHGKPRTMEDMVADVEDEDVEFETPLDDNKDKR